MLSDSNLRADYDKHGKKKPTGEVGLHEATEMFGQLFGGDRFVDLIGEISLLKDFGKASEILMTEEEKAEADAALRASQTDGAPAPSAAPQQGTLEAEKKEGAAEMSAGAAAAAAGASPAEAAKAEQKADEKKKSDRAKLTPEQRAKLDELEQEKEKAEKERIEDLTRKLKDRIRPFVEVSAWPGTAQAGLLLKKDLPRSLSSAPRRPGTQPRRRKRLRDADLRAQDA